MGDDEESRSVFDRVMATKREASPDSGYQLAEWDLFKPPTEQVGRTSQWWLTLSDVSVPSSSEFTDWSVFDRYTNDYATPRFLELPEEPEPESVLKAVNVIEEGDEKDLRIELVRIRRVAEQHPDACEPAVPILVDKLSSADIEEQAEILGVFRELAFEAPELVQPAIEVLGGFLNTETDDQLRKSAILVIIRVTVNEPSSVTDLIPKLEVLLKDTTGETNSILLILIRIAKVHPEAVLPIIPNLIEYVNDASHAYRVGAVAVLGHISKAYPNVAIEVIPTAHELLSADNNRLRANAAGLLADLAGEYPEKVRPAVPDAIDLLSDEDSQVRYNATSILARVADHDPEAVELGTEALIDALTEEQPAARENACWALGYLRATTAKEKLATIAESDPNERVRKTASWALDKLPRS